MQLFRRKSRSVNAVLADATARHDDQIARFDFFLMCRFSLDPRGHYSGCAAVNKGLAQESFIKNNAAVNSGDAAFIPSVFHAFAYSFINPARMENTRRQFLFMKRRSKTKNIGIENQLCSEACAKWIAVDANYAGKRSTIGIKSGR